MYEYMIIYGMKISYVYDNCYYAYYYLLTPLHVLIHLYTLVRTATNECKITDRSTAAIVV